MLPPLFKRAPRSPGHGATGKITAALAALTVCLFAATAHANKDFPPFGGSGDHQNTDSCPHGGPASYYLTGLTVRAGDWMDQASIICAAVSPLDLSLGQNPGWMGPDRGGTGGAPQGNTMCNKNEVIIGVNMLMTPENRQVRRMELICSSIVPGGRHILDVGNTGNRSPANVHQQCPAGEAIQAITFNWGKHVNAIGIQCRPLPVLKPASTSDATTGGYCSTLAGRIMCNTRFVLNDCIKADLTKQNTACPPVDVGDGECTHFVQYMLKHAGARLGHFGDVKQKDYTWGTKLASLNDLKAGDVLQFWDAQFTSPDGKSSWGTGVSSDPSKGPNHHTAIYGGKDESGLAILWEQNVNKVRKVMRNKYHLEWKHTGDVVAFRPVQSFIPRH